MPDYLLHPHGRGRLYGDSEANRSTFIDKTSSASDFAKLRDCRLVNNSQARGSCQIYGGYFDFAVIEGSTIVAGNPHVNASRLNCSEVSGKPAIFRSFLLGSTEVCDSPTIKDSTLRDAIVYGSPLIQIDGNFEVTGRVHEGIWDRPPKHIKLPWCDLSECVVKNGEQHVLLDCRCRSVSYWLRHGAKLARRWSWSEDMIEITLDTIRKAFYNPQHGVSIPLSQVTFETKATS